MKAFIRYVRDFIKKDFNFFVYAYTAVFLAVAIYFNYRYNFMTDKIGVHTGSWKGLGYGYLFFAVFYYGVAVPKLVIAREGWMLRSWSFYVRTSFLLLMLTIGIFSDTRKWVDAIVSVMSSFRETDIDAKERYYLFYNASHFKFFVCWFSANFMMYVVTTRYYRKPSYYGLTLKAFNLKLYSLMFMVMIPLLYYASLQDSFLATYPILKIEFIDNVFNLSTLKLLLIFEIIYALAFVGTEVLFRGAFVLGLLDIVDHHAVLPMTSLYCVIHFNKPMLEAISAIFGGYLLGILALATFNVIGGILIHIAIAWGMDFLSIFRKNIPLVSLNLG
ncbi:hypothetical protein COTS27_00608 [Spirochaetota bacterium]|nr:hypothetical protein COTS27_00608 [Spirochaetota bacterium]